MVFSPIVAMESIEGFVPSIGSAVKITRSALAGLELRLAQRLRNEQAAAFSVGGHQLHGGGPWAPLAPSTIKIKSRLGATRPSSPLFRTGIMSQNQKVKVDIVPTSTGLSFRVLAWNSKQYSRFHQSGYRHVWSGKMVPKRPVVSLTKQDFDYVAGTIRDYMIGIDSSGTKKKTRLGKVKGWLQGAAARLWKLMGPGKKFGRF